MVSVIIKQACSEGTSSVAFQVITINSQISFMNSFIFNSLTLNIKLFIFKLFDVKFLFFLIYSEYLSFEALGLDHIGRFRTKICEIQVGLWNKEF